MKIFKKEIPTLKYFYLVHSRIIPQSDILSEDDYKSGFGMNHGHYYKLCRKREELGLPIREDFKESYDHRNGYYITGEKIIPKHHPLHDKMLLDQKTGKKYHIDIVSIQHHYGKVITLVTREDGTKSHGSKDWEIITCRDKMTIKKVKENQKQYKLIDK